MTEIVNLVVGRRHPVRAEVVKRTDACVTAVEVASGRTRFVLPGEAREIIKRENQLSLARPDQSGLTPQRSPRTEELRNCATEELISEGRK